MLFNILKIANLSNGLLAWLTGTTGLLEDNSQVPVNNPTTIGTKALTSNRHVWPQATVWYKYQTEAEQRELDVTINDAMRRWTDIAPWLNFTQLETSDKKIPGVLTINISDYRCFSTTGYNATAERVLSLWPEGCGVAEATHELGHVLGFLHEHQRPDREKYIHYECANVDPVCDYMPNDKTCCHKDKNSTEVPKGCCERVSNFDPVKGGGVDASGPYDITSIMQYPGTHFALPGRATLVVVPGSNLTLPSENIKYPSAQDANRLCSMYKTLCPRAQMCEEYGCGTQRSDGQGDSDELSSDQNRLCAMMGCDSLFLA